MTFNIHAQPNHTFLPSKHATYTSPILIKSLPSLLLQLCNPRYSSLEARLEILPPPLPPQPLSLQSRPLMISLRRKVLTHPISRTQHIHLPDSLCQVCPSCDIDRSSSRRNQSQWYSRRDGSSVDLLGDGIVIGVSKGLRWVEGITHCAEVKVSCGFVCW